MKMFRKLLAVSLLVFGIGCAAFAGPLVGINLDPVPGAQAGFSLGWAFDECVLVVNKANFATWIGNVSVLAAWTPGLSGFALRAGPQLNLFVNRTGLYYNGLAIVIGAQRSWGMVNLYGQLELSSTYTLTPRIGFEIEFAWSDGVIVE